MKWIRVATARLRGLLQREKVEQDIDEELRAHIEMALETGFRRFFRIHDRASAATAAHVQAARAVT